MVFRKLGVKRKFKMLWEREHKKRGLLSYFDFCLPPNVTRSTIKHFSLVQLTFRACTFSVKKMQAICWTGLLHSSKLVHLTGQNLTCFT